MIGASIFKADGALRYFEDPTKDGRSIGNASDYRSGMDVHYSSGVFNRAFYILSHKPGWNVKTAFLVFAEANKNYWTEFTDFYDGACGVFKATEDRGMPVADAEDAFSQVGVASCIGMEEVEEQHKGSVAKDEWVYYGPFNSSSPLRATMNGTGDADLYVKAGSQPSSSNYDCRPYEPDSSESCTVQGNEAIYIAINGYSDAEYTLTLRYGKPMD